MELQEFDVIYTCQKAIKGQVIIDILVEAPYDDITTNKGEFQDELVALVENKIWTLFFDGYKCLQGDGSSIVLVYPEGGMILMAYKLHFECTNNMAEYEALVLRLKVVINIEINKL